MSNSDRPLSAPRRVARRLAHAAAVSACAGLLLLGGCDSSVDFFDEGAGPLAFYVFGSLDTRLDTQRVRVEAVRTGPEPVGLPPGTQVRLSGGGETVVLHDTTVATDDGGVAHLFLGAFAPVPGTGYALEVSAPGRRTTTAFTVVPQPPGLVRTAEGDSVVMTFAYDGLRTVPWSVEVEYRVQVQGREPETVALRQEVLTSLRDGSWLHRVFVEPDLRRLRDRLGVPETHIPVRLFEARLRIEQRSVEWETGDVERPPDGGFGFLGAVAFFDARLPVALAILDRNGFVDDQLDE